MKSKLNYLISVSLKRKIKTKWFVIANVLLALAIVGIINIDSIITFFGGDFNQKTKIYVLDQTEEESFSLLKQNLEATESLTQEDEGSSYEIILSDQTEEEMKDLLKEKEEEDNIAIVLEDSEQVLDATIITKSYLSALKMQELNSAIQNTKITLAMQKYEIPPDQMNAIYNPIEIDRIYLDESKNQEDENMEIITTTVFPIVILPFFMLTIFLVQMIGAEVNDEKTTRGMEIIISSVSPTTHFFSKVIAGNLFILLQAGLLVLYSGLGIFLRNLGGGASIQGGVIDEVVNIGKSALSSGLGDKLLYVLPLTLLLMVLTFIAYSLVAGILASMTTNIEDFQQLQTPIILVSLVGYYLAMMAGVFNGALFIRILSYVPFISAILSPSLLILGQISVVDILLSIVLMVGTIYFLIKYGLRIYKVGILNYSSNKLWRKMWKAVRQK